MRAAIAECRRLTMAHIPLPRGEAFTLEFVTGRSWSGYNWYQGNYRSLIQVNNGAPVRMSRAIDLGCHEGYPGHHVYNILLEQRLARGRNWVEFTIYPLYSPQSFIAEGSANYGIELAFTGAERLAYERRVLYPLAGIPARDAPLQSRQDASRELAGARFTIARELLEAHHARAFDRLTRRYSRGAPAGTVVAFTAISRLVKLRPGSRHGRGPDGAGGSRGRAWAAMRRILSEPTLHAPAGAGR